MKKILLLAFIVVTAFSCIKKKALKYDPGLVGTWVSNQDSVYTWLIITADGMGKYHTDGNDEPDLYGEVKYSLFEKKMWIGKEKFKVTMWRPGDLEGKITFETKEYETLKDTTYVVDEKMILKTTRFLNKRSVVLYRIAQ